MAIIPLSEARRLVLETEVALRKLIVTAAESADYCAVQLLSTVAERLGELGQELGGAHEPRSEKPALTDSSISSRTPSQTTLSQRKRKHYPRFESRNGTLCKIGWSKKSKSEYEHRVPRESCGRIIGAIDAVAHLKRKVFTVDDVLKQLNDDSIPIYQLYAVVSLLRVREILQKQGRDGYKVNDLSALKATDTSIWNNHKDG